MVYFADGAVQPQPVAGQQFVRVGNGDTIDIIIQNLPANANGASPSICNGFEWGLAAACHDTGPVRCRR